MPAKWEEQNKVRPGVYGRNTSDFDHSNARISDRGVCALPLPLDWGFQGLIPIKRGEKIINKIGYTINDEEVKVVREAFKNAKVIYLYNPLKGGAEATKVVGELTVKAKLKGKRGNDITVAIERNLNDTFEVTTFIGTTEVERLTIKEVNDLESDFINIEGQIEEAAGIKLEGGNSGTATNEDYIKFLQEVEKEVLSINAIGYIGQVEEIKELFLSFTNRIRDQIGHKIQCVLPNYSEADNEAIYSVKNGVIINNEELKAEDCVAFVLGAVAGVNLRQSLTFFKYPGATQVTGDLSNEDIEEALLKGEIVFTMARDKSVIIEQDLTTLKTFSVEKPRVLRKGRPSRALDAFDKDVDDLYYNHYIGKLDSNDDDRSILKNEIFKLSKMYEEQRALINVRIEDFEVEEGTEADSVYLAYKLQPLDSIDKIYKERVIK